ncbi:MAG TPA: ABC transporter permease [Vicinamibacteria bacterium]
MRPQLGAAVAIAAALLAWEAGLGLTGIPEYLLPRPSAIASKWWETFPVQMEHLAMTASTTLAGLALGLAVGVAIGLAVVYVRPLQALVLPAFAAFNGIPKMAVAPLLVIWFGLGSESKVLLAFLMSLFPIFVGSASGLGEIEPDVLDLARLAGGTPLRIFRKVRLPHSLPYLSDAVKVAFPLALAGSIVGEFIGGNQGAGYLILSGQFNLDTPLVFACLLSVTLFTSLGIGALVLLDRLLLGWRPSRRPER